MTEAKSASVTSKVSDLWITSPSGVIFILENMPDGISFFSADINSALKVNLLILSIEKSLNVEVIYESNGESTVEAQEIRISVPS